MAGFWTGLHIVSRNKYLVSDKLCSDQVLHGSCENITQKYLVKILRENNIT